jgi:uncharacterized small protein (DUF1192 family)
VLGAPTAEDLIELIFERRLFFVFFSAQAQQNKLQRTLFTMSDVNIADRIQQVRKEIETLKEQLKKKRADKNDIECKF